MDSTPFQSPLSLTTARLLLKGQRRWILLHPSPTPLSLTKARLLLTTQRTWIQLHSSIAPLPHHSTIIPQRTEGMDSTPPVSLHSHQSQITPQGTEEMDSTMKSHPTVSASKLPVPSGKDVQVIGIQTALDVHASKLTSKIN